jgi:ATP-dependent DNA ligase
MNVKLLKRLPTRRAAPKACIPGFIQPCAPTLQERAPTSPNWVYEVKTNGYRAQVHVRDGEVTHLLDKDQRRQ